MAILHFLELDPFSYYSVFTKTLNMRNVKYILAYIKIYILRKKSKALWDNDIHALKYGRRISWKFSYLWI